MDSPSFLTFGSGLVVNGFAENVENSSERTSADGNGDRTARINCVNASYKSVCGGHCDASNDIVADMLCNLADKLFTVVVNFYCIQKIRQVILFKCDIDYRTDDLDYLTDIFLWHYLITSYFKLGVQCIVTAALRSGVLSERHS